MHNEMNSHNLMHKHMKNQLIQCITRSNLFDHSKMTQRNTLTVSIKTEQGCYVRVIMLQ